MRVITGYLGGRQFAAPSGHRTHPMSEKVRGGLFNALGDIEYLTLLDAFAGSGAVSIEAISRGATSAVAIELDVKAYRILAKNLVRLDIADKVKAIRANSSGWSDKNANSTFDIVVADPPYNQIQLKVLIKLISHLKPNSIFVLSWPGKIELPEFGDLELIKDNNYGDAQLAFYHKLS